MFTPYLQPEMKQIRPSVLTLLITSFMMISALSCKQQSDNQTAPQAATRVTPPEWSYNANIYEVNIRQYTPEGTFEAFRQHLPRLKKMGVDILWLMPIHPISEPKRKGTLGSYYAVSDFRAVNPNFGTHQDFRQLVDSAHALGMYVVLDLVPHHTGWDHPWITNHPEYYKKTKTVRSAIRSMKKPASPGAGPMWQN